MDDPFAIKSILLVIFGNILFVMRILKLYQFDAI